MRHLEITTFLPCPNMCSYCPQGKLMNIYRGEKVLRLENFEKMLKNVPKDVQIHFSGFGEAFVNKDGHEMVKRAYEEGYEVHVYTTTVGLKVEELEGINFGEFHVHDIGKAKHVPYADIVEKIDNPISRGGNLWDIEEKQQPLTCTRSATFEQNVMLPNGDVYLCCMDWSLKHRLGNIFTTNFNNLKRDKQYRLCQTCEKSQ